MSTGSTGRKFSDQERVATCGICVLADAMKPCKQGIKCAFAIGLPFRELKQESIPVIPELSQRDTFARFAAGYLKNIPNGAA